MPSARQKSLAPVFNAAHAALKTYAFDYQGEVTGFYKDHPAFRDKIYFVDMTGQGTQIIRPLEDAEAAETKLRSNTFLFNSVARMQKDGFSFCVQVDDFNAIVIDRAASRRGLPRLTGAKSPVDIENVYVFDHEVGHLICADGYGYMAPNLKECVADAYAVIRHIQRFGSAEGVAAVPSMRAVELAFRNDSGAHFTAPTVAAIIEDSKTTDFSTLTPGETAALATTYARRNMLPYHKVSNMYYSFLRFNKGLTNAADGDMELMKTFAARIVTTATGDEFKFGSQALKALVAGQVLCDGKHVKLAGRGWQKVLRDLDARAEELAKAAASPVPPAANLNSPPNAPKEGAPCAKP
ncbi:MAG: hypothetical protein PW788_07345 [Micavibrio sp.]|nr:hypothetical protein [Micavibrio sp.]